MSIIVNQKECTELFHDPCFPADRLCLFSLSIPVVAILPAGTARLTATYGHGQATKGLVFVHKRSARGKNVTLSPNIYVTS